MLGRVKSLLRPPRPASAVLATLGLAAAGCAGLGASLRGPEEGGPPWREVASDHFQVWTDLEDAEARALAAQLEWIHQAVVAAAWTAQMAPGSRMGVVALRSHRELRSFTVGNPPGWVIPDPDQTRLVLSAPSGEAPVPAVAREVALHLADLAWLRRGPSPAVLTPDEDDDEGEEAPERPSFWRSVGEKLRSLVVRRSDGKPVPVPEEEIAALFATTFPIPVESYDLAKLRDTFLSRRGKQKKHHAIDLGAPRGTPVLAVVDGVIERLGRDRRGGKVVYLSDPTGRFTFYYAHLGGYAKGLKSGDRVTKGQHLGEVGATGRVIGGPHLHFAIFRNEAATGSRLFAVNPYLIFSTLLPR